MPGTFQARMDELEAKVGGGTLSVKNTVDQVYAFNVHEGYWINYMGRFGPKTLQVHSGEGHFLKHANEADFARRCQRWADSLFDEGPRLAAVENALDLLADTARRTPVEFGDLAESGHVTVTDGEAVIFDQPPLVARLGARHLAAKSRQLSQGDMRRRYLGQQRLPIHPRARAGHPRHARNRRAPWELP